MLLDLSVPFSSEGIVVLAVSVLIDVSDIFFLLSFLELVCNSDVSKKVNLLDFLSPLTFFSVVFLISELKPSIHTFLKISTDLLK